MHEQNLDKETPASGHEKRREKAIAVAVVTPSGTFPSEDEYWRSEENHLISDILSLAGVKLKLTNTTDWVAYFDDKLLDVNQTFKHAGLHDIVEIEWHKQEGGGGA